MKEYMVVYSIFNKRAIAFGKVLANNEQDAVRCVLFPLLLSGAIDWYERRQVSIVPVEWIKPELN